MVIAIFVLSGGSAVTRLLEILVNRVLPQQIRPTARNSVQLPCVGRATYLNLLLLVVGYRCVAL